MLRHIVSVILNMKFLMVHLNLETQRNLRNNILPVNEKKRNLGKNLTSVKLTIYLYIK